MTSRSKPNAATAARTVTAIATPGPGNPVLMARSDDGGATWQPAVRVTDPRRGRVLAPSAGLRNVLVHQYAEIDLDQVVAAVGRARTDFRAYVQAITDGLSTEASTG